MDNSDLSKLKIAPGKLLPKFKASTTEYSVIVASTVTEVKLSPLTSDSGASYVIKVSCSSMCVCMSVFGCRELWKNLSS